MSRITAVIVASLTLVGCVTPGPTYRWSSEEGRSCTMACRSSYFRCDSQCFGHYACGAACAQSEWACVEACPDVKVEYPAADNRCYGAMCR